MSVSNFENADHRITSKNKKLTSYETNDLSNFPNCLEMKTRDIAIPLLFSSLLRISELSDAEPPTKLQKITYYNLRSVLSLISSVLC